MNIVTYNLQRQIKKLLEDLDHIISVKGYDIKEASLLNGMIVSGIKTLDTIMSKPIQNVSAETYINLKTMADAIEECINKFPETAELFKSHGIIVREDLNN